MRNHASNSVHRKTPQRVNKDTNGHRLPQNQFTAFPRHEFRIPTCSDNRKRNNLQNPANCAPRKEQLTKILLPLNPLLPPGLQLPPKLIAQLHIRPLRPRLHPLIQLLLLRRLLRRKGVRILPFRKRHHFPTVYINTSTHLSPTFPLIINKGPPQRKKTNSPLPLIHDFEKPEPVQVRPRKISLVAADVSGAADG